MNSISVSEKRSDFTFPTLVMISDLTDFDIRAIKKLTRVVPLWEIKNHSRLKDIDPVSILNIDFIDEKM